MDDSNEKKVITLSLRQFSVVSVVAVIVAFVCINYILHHFGIANIFSLLGI
ncbi:MAG: hypothetical protein FWC79_02630 [Oscillospiraceae bacterium]|nr:hypothetical protein [Oscillospiraceae bacterium]